MTVYKTILFILITPYILFCQGNKKLDSLLNSYNNAPSSVEKLTTIQELYNFYSRSNLENALKYTQEEIELATKLNNTYYLFIGNYNLGYYHYNTGKRDSARVYNDKASAIYKNNESLGQKTTINSLMAKIHYANVEDDEALELLNLNLSLQDSLNLNTTTNYGKDLMLKAKIYQVQDRGISELSMALQALKIFEANNDQLQKATALQIIAGSYARTKDFQKGLEHLLEALNIYKEFNDKKNEAILLSSVGSYYVLLDQRPTAKKYFEQLLALSKEQNLLSWIATAYDKLGGLEVEAGNYDAGIKLLEKGAVILRKSKDQYSLSIALLNIGNAYYDKKSYNRAIETLNECISISNKKELLAIAYKYRSASYEALNNLKPAIKDYKMHKTLKDSLFNISKSRQIEELRAIYETEKQEQQITLQNNEINLLKQEAKISNLQRLLLGIGFLLSLIGFYAIRQKLKRQKLEKEKLDTDLAFKKKELTTHALHLAKKNEVLEGLKQKAKALKSSDNNQNGYQQLITTINFDLKNDNNWENFSKYFQEVHKDFNSNLKKKFPELTSNELRLMSLLKMNLSSKEIANILNISPEGVKKARYRLRKKLNITTEDSLQDLVLKL